MVILGAQTPGPSAGSPHTVRGGIMEFETIESKIIHLQSELPKKSMPEISLEDRQQKEVCGLWNTDQSQGKIKNIFCNMKFIGK